MKNQRYLSIVFDAIIKQNEVAALRAAIAEKVGFEKDIFHNHRPDGRITTVGKDFYFNYSFLKSYPVEVRITTHTSPVVASSLLEVISSKSENYDIRNYH